MSSKAQEYLLMRKVELEKQLAPYRELAKELEQVKEALKVFEDKKSVHPNLNLDDGY